MGKSTFILIAGAWHGAWFWEPVKEILQKAGHKVVAPDLPGHGNDNTPLKNLSIEDYTNFIVKIIDEQVGKVILVGHSMGGVTACQAAEYRPEKIEKLVILCGFLLNNGESSNGLQDGFAPTDWNEMAAMGAVTLSPDKKVIYLTPVLAREKLYNEMTDEEAEKAIRHLSGESVEACQTPVNLGSGFKSVPKIYIRTLKDRMATPDFQDKMVLRGVDKVYEINTDHSPFRSAPLKLSEVLLDIEKQGDGSSA